MAKRYSKEWYLDKAQERLNGGKNWTQGKLTTGKGPDRSFCLLGSVVGGNSYTWNNEGQRNALNAIREAINKLYPSTRGNAYSSNVITDWNDDKRRKPEQVLRVIEAAKRIDVA